MVKEKLKKSLEDAVGYYNEGLSANEAVIKSASENDLTIDQTDRVVESFNTAKTINFFDKHASDRTGKFDLASKKDVTLALFGKTREKCAEANNMKKSMEKVSDDGFYFSNPDTSRNRKNIFAEKRANFLDILSKVAEEKWKHGYSDKTLQDMASDAYSTIKSAEADIDSALGTIDNYLWTATEKIAKEISRGAYDIPEDKADLFKVACPHKNIIAEVSKFSPLLKSATGGVYRTQAVVDTTPIDDLLKEADDIAEAIKHRTYYRTKKAEFAKKAKDIKSAMLRDPSLSGKLKKEAQPEALIHRPHAITTKKADSVISQRNLLDTLIDVPSRSKNIEAIRDEERGAILAELMASDPILQDADPAQVSAIYKSIVASSPRVSLNKEVIRSVLRSAVNSIALSPNDTKVLTDVDHGINRAYNSSGPASESEHE